MKKKTSVLVLTGAITISNIGLTTSFADVNDETLLIQQISNKVHSQVSIEADGSARIAGQDGQLGTADDVFVRTGKNGEVPDVDQFENVKVQDGSKVVSSNGNTINVQNESVVSINGIVTQPDGSIIDSNGNNNQGGDVDNSGENVTNPGENTNKPSESVTKPSVNVNNSGVSTENPNTGDRSVMGMLVLGSMALLALVKNLKIKDKLFLK